MRNIPAFVPAPGSQSRCPGLGCRSAPLESHLPNAPTAADRTVVGLGIAFVSFLLLSMADAGTKLLSERGTSVFQVAVVDAVFALAVALPFLVRQDGVASLKPRRPWIVILRCLAGAGSLMLAFLSFSQ